MTVLASTKRFQETLPPSLGTVRRWGLRVGRDAASMIIRGWRKPLAMSHPSQVGVAKPIHLSGKAATSASGRLLPASRCQPTVCKLIQSGLRASTSLRAAIGRGVTPSSLSQPAIQPGSVGEIETPVMVRSR